MDRRRFLVLVALAIVVPAGFLVTLELIGMLGGPIVIAETMTLEPVEWDFEKSSFTPEFHPWVESSQDQCAQNFYLNDAVNVTFTYSLLQYFVLGSWYGGGPQLAFRVNLTASVAQGFVHDVHILFREDYNASDVYFECIVNSPLRSVKLRNLNFSNEWACLWHNEEELEGDLKAFVVAYGFNQPSEVEVDLSGIFWILRAEEDLSQQLEATAEITYYNGTDYVKVALPILIDLVGDVSETFEDARTITAGSYVGSISEWHDAFDCYKIWLDEDQNITISTVLRRICCVNITVYDPSGTPKASVKPILNPYGDPLVMDDLAYTAGMKGYWYIEVHSYDDQGLYKLTITVE